MRNFIEQQTELGVVTPSIMSRAKRMALNTCASHHHEKRGRCNCDQCVRDFAGLAFGRLYLAQASIQCRIIVCLHDSHQLKKLFLFIVGRILKKIVDRQQIRDDLQHLLALLSV